MQPTPSYQNGHNRRPGQAPLAAPAPDRIVAARHVEPTGREARFGADEIIVTKTDLTGHLTYANDVFLRVAGYTEAEVIGQPHSFIRHPEMPRAVFKLLWDTIQGGREVFAYVVNLTKHGDHYWVFAHVTPTLDGTGATIGYHSNRRCPDRDQVEAISDLYREMVQVERAHARKPDGIAASMQLVDRAIAARGLTTYEEFVFSL